MTGLLVLAAPAIDPGTARVEMELPEGMAIAGIIEMAMPGLPIADRARLRVSLVSAKGATIIVPEYWHVVRPRAGVRVVIRLIPGKGAVRAVLSIVVSVAAVALGVMFGPAVGAFLGITGSAAYVAAVGGAVVALGVNLLGSLLINALIPPVKPDTDRRPSYSISGWQNRFDPDGTIPVVLGQIRYAPPFAARNWTEIIGDWQYVHAMFNFGEGPLDLTDFRIGETSLAEFDEVEIEVRQGFQGDMPSALYPTQIVEDSIGVELTRPLVRDDLGGVVSGTAAVETPVVRSTGTDATGASVLIAFPGGLARYNDDGKRRSHGISVRIEQRPIGSEVWQTVTTLEVSARLAEAFYRQHTWQFPTRARYQVRLTMLTDETEDSKIQQRCVWAALQTLRPEYPLNYGKPLALVSLRVKATHQLNGALDNFSATARRICLDWDHVTGQWLERATSNPASLYRFVLQCRANPKPMADADIDLELLADWHDFCRLKGLMYNRVQDQSGTTLREILTEVAAAGRATPRHDGLRWGVVIDRPAALIVDHINPRNSWGFSTRRAYVERPHAWICKFQDEGNDYKEAQRVIRRPDYEGDITLTETLVLPGITNPETIYREGVRRFYEAQYRPDSFEATQEGAVRVVTRGDAVMLSHDVLSRTQSAARVRAVAGNLVELDEVVQMLAGQSYALRFRVFAGTQDTVGTSVVRAVQTQPGETGLLAMTGTGPAPGFGDIVHFGLMGTDSYQMMVTHIEATEDQCSIIRAVEAAPIIDTLTDALEVPAWSSAVGAEIDASLIQPAAPRFTSVSSGLSGTDTAAQLSYLLVPGSGAVAAATFRIDHRLGTSGAWTEVTIPAANGGGVIAAYAQGDTVQLQARAVSANGVAGPFSLPITLVIGAGDAPIPAAMDADAVNVTTLLGGALIQLATGTDPNTTRLQLYRSTSATLDRAEDAAGDPLVVSPLQSYSVALGDTTRSNLIIGGSMDNAANWTLGPGWGMGGGKAAHATGAIGEISQAFATESGKWYRVAFSVADRTAGSLTPRLTGGSTRLGATVLANGEVRDRIQAVTGNDTFGLNANADFDGSVDNLTAYLETTACLSQGTHYVWIEPQNADGAPGPVLGPITLNIV